MRVARVSLMQVAQLAHPVNLGLQIARVHRLEHGAVRRRDESGVPRGGWHDDVVSVETAGGKEFQSEMF